MKYLTVDQLRFDLLGYQFYSHSRIEEQLAFGGISTHYSIELYTSGCGKYLFDNVPYELETGSILIRRPGIVSLQDHSYKYESYYLGFDVTVKGTGESLPSEEYRCFLDQLPIKIVPENFSDFLQIVKGLPNSNPIQNTEKESLTAMSALSRILLFLYPFSQGSDQKEPFMHPVVKKAISFFRANADTSVSMKEAAEFAGVSEKYFQQVFKDYTGKTPNNYFIELRMNIAIRKLLTTDMSISEIAYESGFTNSNYFSQLFKKIYYKTPSEFRRGRKFKQ